MLLTAYLTVKYIKIRLYNLRIIKHLYRYRSCPTLCYCKHNTTRKHVLLLVKIVFHNIMKLPDRIFFFSEIIVQNLIIVIQTFCISKTTRCHKNTVMQYMSLFRNVSALYSI